MPVAVVGGVLAAGTAAAAGATAATVVGAGALGMAAGSMMDKSKSKSGSSGGDGSQYDPLIGQAAMKEAEVSQAALNFYRQQYEEGRPRQQRAEELANELSAQQLEIAKANAGIATEQWQRFKQVFVPVEDQMVRDAMNIDSTAEQNRVAGEAAAGVQNQYENAMGQARRAQQAMGVNPNSGNAQALNQEGALGLAGTKAAAANNARLAVRDRGIALRAGAANFGRNMPNTSAQASGVALNAGNSAMSQQVASNNIANANATVGGQGFNTAVAGYGAQGSILNTLRSTTSNAYQAMQNREMAADAANSSGIGSLIGTGVGAYLAYASSKKLKEGKKKVSHEAALKGIRKTPVESWKYKEGEGDGGAHVGPYAEDVQKNLGDKVAPGGKQIDVISMIGTNMAAIKALDEKVEGLDKKVSKKSPASRGIRKEARA